jgi:hypothetical protein
MSTTIGAADPHPRRRSRILDARYLDAWFDALDLKRNNINADPGAQIVGRIRDFCRG